MNRKIFVLTLLFFLLTFHMVSAQDCGIKFLTSLYAKRIEEGMITTQSFTLKNTCNDTVILKEYILSGTIMTKEGEKPIDISELSLGELPGKGETKVIIDINTVEVASGKYSPSLTISGYHNEDLLTATLGFEITVVAGVAPPSDIEVNIPEKVYSGEVFSINVSGIESGSTISLFHSYSEVNQISVEQSDIQWVWKGTINNTGVYTMNILISSAGLPLDIKGPYTITVEEKPGVVNYVDWNLNPTNPTDGVTVSVGVVEKGTMNPVSGCKVYINTQERTQIIVDAKQTYNIRIDCLGKELFNNTLTIPALTCLIIEPSEIIDGDEITFDVKTSDTQIPLTGTIHVDGTETTTYTSKEGTHTVKFENVKYTCEKSITVEPSLAVLNSTMPNSTKVGEKLYFTANKKADWKVVSENNVTIDSDDDSSKFTFKNTDNPGTYDLWLDGREVGSFTIESLPFYVKYFWSMVMIGVVLSVIILFIVFKKRKRTRPVFDGSKSQPFTYD